MDAGTPGYSKYQYDNLSGPLPIRLLVLFPADTFEAPLRCKLEATDLLFIVLSRTDNTISKEAEQAGEDTGNTQDNLAFEALSYTWGSSEHTNRIILDDNAFLPITGNLEAFLRYRREAIRPVRLWVDAVSINQENTAERNAQVTHMNKIYAAAPRMTVWLGPPADQSDAAMRELKTLSAGHPFQKLSPMKRSVFTAIEKLLTRDWWRRVWIIQELTFGVDKSKERHVRVMCGQQSIEWVSLILACARLKLSGRDWRRGSPAVDNALLLDTLAQSFMIQPTLSFQEYQKEGIMQLLRNVVEFRHFKATKLMDKIFALSGMVLSKQYSEPIFPVNYEFSKEKIYTDFATTVMSLTKDLGVLCHCQKQPNTTVLPTALASWVPDWSSPLHTKLLPSRQYQERHIIPWWSTPDRVMLEDKRIGYRLAAHDVLRKLAKKYLEPKGMYKFNSLPSYILDTMPEDMVSMIRELTVRGDLISCTLDEGDVMDGESLTKEEALARRIWTMNGDLSDNFSNNSSKRKKRTDHTFVREVMRLANSSSKRILRNWR